MEENLRKILRFIRRHVYRAIDIVTPTITHRSYLGYRLFYSNGTGIVDRIRFLSPQKIYEEKICTLITHYLKQKTDPIFFDIGANIGFISLYVKKYCPNALIYAFEPGLHQRSLLEMTVFTNALFSDIQILPYAVSNKSEFVNFYTNSETRDVGGDGMLDTLRSSHPSHQIKVESVTLDTFVSQWNIPKIDVIKIDIEGAELWAFEGSKRIISTMRPIIFFEMQPLNLRVYPYTTEDIFAFLTEHGYQIQDLDGIDLTLNNLSNALTKDDMFVAIPK